MPDLIPRPFAYCKSVENFVYVAKGSKGDDYIVRHGPSVFGEYQYDWHCQCKGFEFRRQCRHIEEAKKHYCGWDQFVDGDEPNDGHCPICDGEVSSRLVGV